MPSTARAVLGSKNPARRPSTAHDGPVPAREGGRQHTGFGRPPATSSTSAVTGSRLPPLSLSLSSFLSFFLFSSFFSRHRHCGGDTTGQGGRPDPTGCLPSASGGWRQRLGPDKPAGTQPGPNQPRGSLLGSRAKEGRPAALNLPPSPAASSDRASIAGAVEALGTITGRATERCPSLSPSLGGGEAGRGRPAGSHRTPTRHRWGPPLAARVRRVDGHTASPEPSHRPAWSRIEDRTAQRPSATPLRPPRAADTPPLLALRSPRAAGHSTGGAAERLNNERSSQTAQ